MAEPRSHRLPTSVIPERYEIKLTPDLLQWTFTGEVKIAVEVRQTVREVVLNAAELVDPVGLSAKRRRHAASRQRASGRRQRAGGVELS